MKPLIILIIVFVISWGVTLLAYKQADVISSGRIAMAVMLLFTAIGHFKFTKGMAMMLPEFIPAKKLMVLFTGVIELAAAIGLIIGLHQLCAKLLIAFFISITPANIYAAQKNVNLEKANYEGDGMKYLWFRIPLQLFFITWVWYFGVQH